MKSILRFTLYLAILSGMSAVYAQESGADLMDLSLEDLMQMEVTSVSKKAERLQDVASSIYVVTSDDIRKSGATTLHEVLRLVPGYWGVQDQYSNVRASVRHSPTSNSIDGTMLFLLDGTPMQDLMSSTFYFQNFDIPLSEIDRIELIRGSGGSIYGANSATGVINIFTKDPEKYDGITAEASGAAPGYVATSLRAGGKISEKVALSGYGKFRYFSGFESMAGKDEDGNSTVETTDFVENYDESIYYSFGAKMNVDLSGASKLSARLHYNARNQYEYTNSYQRDFVFTRDDQLYGQEVSASRIVANLRFDHSFSDNHSLFVRASTNFENDLYEAAGGMMINNGIIDLEVQDNLSFGINDLSFGFNYRVANFDIDDINDPEYINYVNPETTESLKGAFVQNKFKFMDSKLNLILGLKAENYSLVNDKYYLSPMAKVSAVVSEDLTIWGGFTRSYTTPGFNTTNVDWFLFQTPTAAEWNAALTPQVTPLVEQAVYDQAYQSAIEAGADDATASQAAANYVASSEGQAVIAGGVQNEIQNVVDGTPNIAVKNGSETVPTDFRTLELGVKFTLNDMVQVNSTVFRTQIVDGLSENPGGPIRQNEESITQPGRYANYYLYGNYVQGYSVGSETSVRVNPVSGLQLEVSHSWLKTEWEYQENDDFDVSSITSDPTPNPSVMPNHVFRFKGNYDLASGFTISGSVIYASKFKTSEYYVYGTERYVNIVENEVFQNRDGATMVAANDSRTIVNLRVEKRLLDSQLVISAFGNDVTNSGMVAGTRRLQNVTLSQIGAMYGMGIQYRFK